MIHIWIALVSENLTLDIYTKSEDRRHWGFLGFKDILGQTDVVGSVVIPLE